MSDAAIAASVAVEPRTHLELDPALSGRPVELTPGRSRLAFEATAAMRADDRGLVHGGFVFSLADHAAMLAVNDPNVVLGKAEVRFHRPVAVGDRLEARAEVRGEEGRKRRVAVEVRRGEELVLDGDFLCVVLDRHVLDGR